MQYAVPQFTDVEDKLIGPLTLKQFLFILAIGGIVLFFYALLGLSIFFFFFAVPVACIGLAFTFGTYNGRALFLYTGVFINYLSKPQARIFRREVPNVVIKIQKKTEVVTEKTAQEPAESRLKKLAYLLDQKVSEEEQLLGQK